MGVAVRMPAPIDPDSETLAAAHVSGSGDTVADASRDGVPARGPSRDRLGRYVVIEQVGQGGMGVVYAAYDPLLDRKVALKLLHPGHGSRAATLRMLREAQAMARLSHPNVVAVHDVGLFDDQIFVAMEFLRGPTLTAWLAERTRTWPEVLATFGAAGRGLQAAHAAGLVHRDFKPDNVILDDDGRPRVTDFGLVRATGLAVDEPAPAAVDATDVTGPALRQELTHAGAVLGTPLYMSPEQHAGRPADARSDQFSFCVALYHALHGVHPFARPDLGLAAAVSLANVADPPRGARVPPWLRRVLVRGLSREPGDRWPDMAALLRALDDDPRRRWRQRLGLAAGLAGIAVAVALALRPREAAAPDLRCRGAEQALVGVWDQARKAEIQAALRATGAGFADAAWAGVEQRLDARTRQYVGMRTDACEATLIRGEQSHALMDLRMACLDRRLRETAAVSDLLARDAAAVVEEAAAAVDALTPISDCADRRLLGERANLPEEPALRARVDQARAVLDTEGVRVDYDVTGAAFAAIEAAVADARAIGYRPLLAEGLAVRGAARLQRDDLAGAEADLKEAVWNAEAGRHDVLAAEVWTDLMYLADRAARYDVGKDMSERASAAVARLDDEPRARARYELYRGHLEAGEGRHAAAREHYQASIAAARANGDVFNEAFATNSLANAVHDLGDYTGALAHRRAAIAVLERIDGVDHPNLIVPLSGVGNELCELGDHDGGIAAHTRSMTIAARARGPESRHVAVALTNIGTCHERAGDYAAARDALTRALAIDDKVHPDGHPDVGAVLDSLGVVLLHLGDHDAAAAALTRSRQILADTLGPDHPLLRHPLTHLADVYLSLGQYPKAMSLYADALRLGDDADALTGQGRALLAVRRPDRAVEALTRALALRERGPSHPLLRADTRAALAAALWDSSAREAPGGARALELADLAERELERAGPAASERLAALRQWRAGRAEPTRSPRSTTP